MNSSRRNWMKSVTSGLGVMVAAALLKPRDGWALEWNKSAFGAESIPASLKELGYGDATPSGDIAIKAPEIAENGAVVPIQVISSIPNTQSIAILVDKNHHPLVGEFRFSSRVDPVVSTRIKMGETSLVRVFVRANGKVYAASRQVKVTIGGCGG